MSSNVIKKIAMIILLFIAILFLGKVGIDNYIDIKNEVAFLNKTHLFLSLVFCLLMLLSKALFHLMLVSDFVSIEKRYNLILSSYAQSQIIRYLPGKVLGIIFQGEKLDTIVSRKVVWVVNVWQMLVTNINGIGVIIFIILYFHYDLKFLAVLALATCIVVFILFRFNFLNQLVCFVNKIKYINLSNMVFIDRSSISVSLFKTLLLQLDWVFYFIFWYFLLPVDISISDSLILGSVYASAALVGLLVLVVPSGWFVREASFIWFGLTLGYSEELLFLLSILARLATILGDIVSALLLGLMAKLIDVRK
ncbi:MAG: hypothetical protein GKR92_12735 [Gammaproteobacteria bacterium]|nr:MAG: hypothetical protein GKR92_12735 [Gammaproteobacteria bacterium]